MTVSQDERQESFLSDNSARISSCVRIGRTTQAQPRRASGGEPRSGTEPAPRRWLQRMVELNPLRG